MKYFLYKKDKKEFVPVVEEKTNKIAREKLNNLFEQKEQLRIPTKYIEQWEDVALFHSKGEVKKASALFIPSEQSTFALNNTLNDLTAREWLPETITVFSQRGLGAQAKDTRIEKLHPAPFSFQDISRLVLFFTKENDRVLDPFSGVASTLKACALNKRIGYGIELNSKYHNLAKQRLAEEIPEQFAYKNKQTLVLGDAIKKIDEFENDFFDFIVTSPPYWNILETIDHKNKIRVNNNLDHKYSDDEKDLANIEDYNKFLDALAVFFDSCSRILKQGKYINIIVSDFRKKGAYYLFHSDLANEIQNRGNFCLKGIRILYQRHKSVFPYGYPSSFVPNFHHQYVLILQNGKK